MSTALGLAGWLCAVAALAAGLVLHLRHGRRAELVARACHELRGPLTAARLGLHLVGRKGGAGAGLAAVEGELARAGLALEDLTAAPCGRRAEEEREPVDLGALVRELALAWSPLARRHGAVLSVVAPGAWVRGDRRRLAQAVANLLANALEHGGGRVGLEVRTSRGRVRVEVEDEGPGLPAPLAGLLGPRRRRGPHGHGLAVAAEVARRHEGVLASAPSRRGAKLVLDLPAADGRRRAVGPARPAGSAPVLAGPGARDDGAP